MQDEKFPNGNFSERLTSLILASGLTQADVARRTGIPPNTISRYCAGKRFPKWEQARKLADVLEMPVELLLQADAARLNEETPLALREEVAEYRIDWQARALEAEAKIESLKHALRSARTLIDSILRDL